jgi:hypothetical protein
LAHSAYLFVTKKKFYNIDPSRRMELTNPATKEASREEATPKQTETAEEDDLVTTS